MSLISAVFHIQTCVGEATRERTASGDPRCLDAYAPITPAVCAGLGGDRLNSGREVTRGPFRTMR